MADIRSFSEQSSLESAPSPEELRDHIRQLASDVRSYVLSMDGLTTQQMQKLVSQLPRLTEEQIISLGHNESLCPICFTPFMALVAEEEIAIAMDSPAHPVEELGVTRLAQPWQCGHLFCRRDISKWIQDSHDSCPTCRRLLIEPNSPAVESPEIQALPPDTEDEELRQIVNQMTVMYERDLTGATPSSVHSTAFGQALPGGRTIDNDDRREFSGMYS